MELKDETCSSPLKVKHKKSDNGGEGGKRVCTEVVGIGRLPEAMLCHILSYLQTRDYVRTSVLSKRWRYVWTSVPCIDIIHFYKDAYFIDFFERLLRLNTVSCLRRLSVRWKIDFKWIDEWINTFMERDIEEVDLYYLGSHKCVKLPTRIFTCKKLVFLKLNKRILVDVPSSVYLPSLKILHLFITEFFFNDSMKNLLEGCPVIEELDIECEKDHNVKTLFVRSSSLKRLTMHSGYSGCLSDLRIVLDVPNVVRLVLNDYRNAQYDIYSLSSLVEADIVVHHGSTLVELLRKSSNAEYLSIRCEPRKPLEDQQLDNFPMFHNLTHLKVSICDPSLLVLQSLLECSPNLVSFVYSVRHKESHQQHSQFKASNCLMLYLEEIKLTGLKGFADEMEMVRYFLKNSMVLKKLSIKATLGVKKQLEMSKKLLTFPRGSSECEIIFD